MGPIAMTWIVVVAINFAHWLLKRAAERREASQPREEQTSYTVTLNHLGAHHHIDFDGTEPSRLAVLHVLMLRTQPRVRQ